MKLWATTFLVLNGFSVFVFASTFPEDEESWQKRIDENIDKNRKSDVTIRIKVDANKMRKPNLILL